MEGRLFSHPNATPQMKADGQVILDGNTGELLSMRASNRGMGSTASLLTASPDEFTRPTTIEAEQSPASAPAPVDQAEIQRLETASRLKAKIDAENIDCVEAFGMPWAMVKDEPVHELMRFYKMVSK
jgi:hypothetical protein